MQKFAVIDIGSNSVRLMYVVDGKVLYKRVSTTRLGEGIADKPALKTTAIERTATAVAEFFHLAKAEGAEEVFAFATAAVRTAENRRVFLEKVRELCGLEIEVVSGETEAEIGILGALGNGDGGVIDAGGASTELVVKKDGVLTYKKSVDIGVVRIKDLCGRNGSKLEKAAETAATEYGAPALGETLYAIGGTATTLAALQLGLTEYDPEKITGMEITVEQMRTQAETLLKKSVEEIAAMPCMPKGRADVLAGGAVLLAVLMEKFNVKKLVVSDRDNLEGYAIKKGLL